MSLVNYYELLNAFIQLKNTGLYENFKNYKINKIFRHSIDCYRSICGVKIPILSNPLYNVKIENVSKIIDRWVTGKVLTYCDFIFLIALLFYVCENFHEIIHTIINKYKRFPRRNHAKSGCNAEVCLLCITILPLCLPF